MDFKERLKIRISYLLILLSIIVYVFSKSAVYETKIDTSEKQSKISDIEKDLDEITVKINMKNSRSQIKKEYPNLELHDNVYYLEKDE